MKLARFVVVFAILASAVAAADPPTTRPWRHAHRHPCSEVLPSTTAGGAVRTATSPASAAEAIGAATTSELASGLAGKANTSHAHPAADISDSTATGRAVLT